MPEDGTPQRIGAYTVLAKIGEGGMGAVYKALDPLLNRTVALKLLPAHLASDTDFVSRFRREATAAARIRHRNVV